MVSTGEVGIAMKTKLKSAQGTLAKINGVIGEQETQSVIDQCFGGGLPINVGKTPNKKSLQKMGVECSPEMCKKCNLRCPLTIRYEEIQADREKHEVVLVTRFPYLRDDGTCGNTDFALFFPDRWIYIETKYQTTQGSIAEKLSLFAKNAKHGYLDFKIVGKPTIEILHYGGSYFDVPIGGDKIRCLNRLYNKDGVFYLNSAELGEKVREFINGPSLSGFKPSCLAKYGQNRAN